MRIPGRFALVGALALLALPALADEVIYFTNGSPMPIRSHTVEGNMIRVDLGDDNSMTFPMEQVERIEDARGQSFSPRETPNQMVPSPGRSEGTSWGEVPSRFRRGGYDVESTRSEPVDRDERGVPTQRPYAGSANAKRAAIRVTGNRGLNSNPTNFSRPGSSAGNRVVTPSAAPAAARSGLMRMSRSPVPPEGDSRRKK